MTQALNTDTIYIFKKKKKKKDRFYQYSQTCHGASTMVKLDNLRSSLSILMKKKIG